MCYWVLRFVFVLRGDGVVWLWLWSRWCWVLCFVVVLVLFDDSGGGCVSFVVNGYGGRGRTDDVGADDDGDRFGSFGSGGVDVA